MPQDVEERLKNARLLVERLRDVGVADEDIYLDPLVCPVSTDSRFGKIVIDTLRAMKAEFPEVQTICGLSNVSFGLPERKWINRAFMVLTMAAGLDAVIIDPLDRVMMALIYAAEATLGKDEFCMEYLSAARSGRLEGLQ
jgi:5-methyltetrahydrofolate--homocysteine methyltransferase